MSLPSNFANSPSEWCHNVQIGNIFFSRIFRKILFKGSFKDFWRKFQYHFGFSFEHQVYIMISVFTYPGNAACSSSRRPINLANSSWYIRSTWSWGTSSWSYFFNFLLEIPSRLMGDVHCRIIKKKITLVSTIYAAKYLLWLPCTYLTPVWWFTVLVATRLLILIQGGWFHEVASFAEDMCDTFVRHVGIAACKYVRHARIFTWRK